MTSQIISYIIGIAIGIIVVLLIDIFWWSIRIRERARGHIAELDAEEQRIKEERRDIPKPERPVDVVVEEHEVTFYTMDNEKHVERFIGLYCKGEFVNEYSFELFSILNM